LLGFAVVCSHFDLLLLWSFLLTKQHLLDPNHAPYGQDRLRAVRASSWV
jgi:hypothetical protein